MLGWRCDQWPLGGLGPDGKHSRGASRILDGERRRIQPFFVSSARQDANSLYEWPSSVQCTVVPGNPLCAHLRVFSKEPGLCRCYTALGIYLAVPLGMTVAQHCVWSGCAR
jgi:hypothetical protein